MKSKHMPLGTQAKLLRVIEESQVRRLGVFGWTYRFRCVSWLRRTGTPEQAVQNKQLREDLYYRLNVFHISLPPLREAQAGYPDDCRGADPGV